MQSNQNLKQIFSQLSGCIKVLAADAIENVKSGHPGMPLGFADVFTVLIFNYLKFNPNNSKWFNRDRLVLSAGHGSMLLYAFYYLTNYSNFTLKDLKNFRQLDSKTAGHPEYGHYDAIECTTGPLGQGIANAVGMAIAEKKYRQRLNSNICDYKIYCIAGDGCLMEGISQEAASLAGHLNLNNLIILFDANKISIDGNINLSSSENHLLRFQALGWMTIEADGHNFEEIDTVLKLALISTKPVFIQFNTIIGRGSIINENTEKVHGSPIGSKAIKLLKSSIGFEQKAFLIPSNLQNIWANAWKRNESAYLAWCELYKKLEYCDKIYLSNQPKLALCDLLDSIQNLNIKNATRIMSGQILAKIMDRYDKAILGSADLTISNGLNFAKNQFIKAGDFSGNFIHYGIREHAMAAIMNGLTVSGFLPIGGTFLVFSDYMRPSIRLAALMRVQVIYIMTHDSIGLGEDGPTHQPIEQLSSLRAISNLLVLRPADYREVAECYSIALKNYHGPSMIVLSRQEVKTIRSNIEISQNLNENQSEMGAYILSEDDTDKVDVAIYSTGSEVSIAYEVKILLNQINLAVRIISIPCFELFFKQSQTYINGILYNSRYSVAIEAGIAQCWYQIIGRDGIFCCLSSFGKSAKAKDLFQHFDLSSSTIYQKIINKINQNLNNDS